LNTNKLENFWAITRGASNTVRRESLKDDLDHNSAGGVVVAAMGLSEIEELEGFAFGSAIVEARVLVGKFKSYGRL
jgi:hypothetical protein